VGARGKGNASLVAHLAVALAEIDADADADAAAPGAGEAVQVVVLWDDLTSLSAKPLAVGAEAAIIEEARAVAAAGRRGGSSRRGAVTKVSLRGLKWLFDCISNYDVRS
jgi:hypothetical protein